MRWNIIEQKKLRNILSEPYRHKRPHAQIRAMLPKLRNSIYLITIAFDIEFNIALIFDLLLKVKEVKLLKRVDFVKILDKMNTET